MDTVALSSWSCEDKSVEWLFFAVYGLFEKFAWYSILESITLLVWDLLELLGGKIPLVKTRLNTLCCGVEELSPVVAAAYVSSPK